jgi:hypothetical protein
VHPWVFSADCARRYGPLSGQATHLAEYAVELAKGHAASAGRQVWVQEIGAPAPHVPAKDAPAFAEASLGNLLACDDVWGVTWWCSCDVDRRLADFPEPEPALGLFTSDRRRKPLAGVFARFAGRHVAGNSDSRPSALVLDDAEDNRPAAGPGGTFFEAWMDAAARGERLAITTTTQAADGELLAARGITELREPR